MFVRHFLWGSIFLLFAMGVFAKRGYLDWRHMVRQNGKMKTKIEQVQEQLQTVERQIASLQNSADYQERVVHQTLGYVRPNETIIEFE